MKRDRKTKIIATLGPASSSVKTIEDLFEAGVDVFRLNFSHGTHDDHARNITIIRELEQKHNHPLTVMVDLQGPKLRIGKFESGSIELEEGQEFQLDLSEELGNNKRVCLPHKEIFQVLEKGSVLLLDDGNIRLIVDHCSPSYAQTIVEVGGPVSNKKGVNVPSVTLPISALTEKDKYDLDFALKNGVDIVALSFVQHPQDIIDAKCIIRGKAKLLAKIEKPRAIKRINDIIKESDAIMIARGDLGVEMALEDVPCVKKHIVSLCRTAGCPVIVATQILESMIYHQTPTRAEASDLATAVYEGVDAVMLSAESATGKYPVKAVKVMDRIIKRVESDDLYESHVNIKHYNPEPTIEDAISIAANKSSLALNAKAIITFTYSGSTSIRASRERPKVPILALTSEIKTARFLNLTWGVNPIVKSQLVDFKSVTKEAISQAVEYGIASSGDNIIVTAGLPENVNDSSPVFISGSTNFVQAIKI